MIEMKSAGPVVVGVDGSESALHAVRWAADQARRSRVHLRLVHAGEVPVGYPPGLVDGHVLRAAVEDQGREWLRQATAAAGAGLRVEVVLELAPAVPVLVHESNRAVTMVLGSRGLGGFTGLLLGSTALAARAHCPVVVVRGWQVDEAPPTEGPVVVGVDGTPAGEAAVAFAFAQASAGRTELVAVHAWTDLLLETAFAGGADALGTSGRWRSGPARNWPSGSPAGRRSTLTSG